ncbi:MAG: ribonuclease III [Deltaproteobacteria bacterium]|nr:ribonuclease III [Deltaproteobacteria bacterium]
MTESNSGTRSFGRYLRFFHQKLFRRLSIDSTRLRQLWELEDIVSYRFRDWKLLDQALTHKSYAHEVLNDNGNHYERMEFLGDAILDAVISDVLLTKFPDADEGDLSKCRSSLVNKRRLARLARRFNLGAFLLLGKGEEQSNGREKPSILACVYESLVGAIYLDGGYRAISKVVRLHFEPLVAPAMKKETYRDFKSRLQEYVQGALKTVPHYILAGESGPPHDKEFEVHIQINGQAYGTGRGKNKKEAQQRAAAATLKQLLGC